MTGRPKGTAGSKLHDTAAEAGEGVEGPAGAGSPRRPAGRPVSFHSPFPLHPTLGRQRHGQRSQYGSAEPNATVHHHRRCSTNLTLPHCGSPVRAGLVAVALPRLGGLCLMGLGPVRRQGLCSTLCGPSPCPKPGPIRSPCVSNCRDSQGTARASGRQGMLPSGDEVCVTWAEDQGPHLPKNIICKAKTEGLADACQPLRAQTRARR